MRITIKDKQTLVGEQKGVQDGEPEYGYIAEMATDPAKLASFGFDQSVVSKAEALKLANDDDKPEFPVVRVEEGWSGSGRLWTGNTLEDIVRQTNTLEPVAHLGHIPDDQAAFAFPPPQTTWIGAITKTEPSTDKSRAGEMVKVAYFAGYNYPGAEIRNYIKNKAVRGVSWWGRGDMIPVPGKGVEVRNFSLQALDWARKLAEGMPTARIVAMAREMKETDKMETDLAQVTPEQFKEANPNGYKLLVNQAQAEMQTQIGEMEGKVEEGKKSKSVLDQIMSLLGVDDPEGLVTTITTLKNKVGEKATAMVNDALDKLLTEKVPNEEKRALVRRLIPVGEMVTKSEDADDKEAVEKIVGEMLDLAFDKDKDIQVLVGEMQPPVVRRREELVGAGGLGKNQYVGEMETRRV